MARTIPAARDSMATLAAAFFVDWWTRRVAKPSARAARRVHCEGRMPKRTAPTALALAQRKSEGYGWLNESRCLHCTQQPSRRESPPSCRPCGK